MLLLVLKILLNELVLYLINLLGTDSDHTLFKQRNAITLALLSSSLLFAIFY